MHHRSSTSHTIYIVSFWWRWPWWERKGGCWVILTPWWALTLCYNWINFTGNLETRNLFPGSDLGPVSRKARELFWPEGKFENLNLFNSTVPSSQTRQFCFVNWQFHCIIFKIIETLIFNLNAANINQLFGPEKLPGLSRNGSPNWFDARFHLPMFFLF